jgi:hypothetical protein
MYHESSYVWDLILAHIWDVSDLPIISECDIDDALILNKYLIKNFWVVINHISMFL